MSRLTNEEELAVIDSAIAKIESDRVIINELREQLIALPEKNAELERLLAEAEAADAASDAKLLALKALTDTAGETPAEPEPEADPETPAEPAPAGEQAVS